MRARSVTRGNRAARSVAVSAVAVLALIPSAVFGSASARVVSAGLSWRVVASTKSAFLYGLVAPSRHSIWALGTGFVKSNPEQGFPFGLHWNGRSWSKASFPAAIGTTGIGCAGATSAKDVWAFAGTSSAGSNATTAGALRLVRGHWKLVKKFPAGIVTGCLVEGPTEVWVFGNAHVAPGTGTWHLHGRTWTHLAFKGFVLGGASAIGPNDVWGAGETSFSVPVVARWNGRSWVRNKQLASALPNGPHTQLAILGVTAISDKSVWLRILVIHLSGGQQTHSFVVLHWTGQTWHHVGPSNVGYFLPGAVRGGDGSWWSFLQPDPFGPVPSGVRHLVHGRWVKVPVKIAGCLAERPYLLTPAGTSSTMLGLQLCPAHPGFVSDVLARGPIR
jgi:hypothetical protein